VGCAVVYSGVISHPNERHPMTLHEMTARAVSKGMNRTEAVALLEQCFDRHMGDNLAYMLNYWGFATENKANKVAAEHMEMLNRM
jgi:hypothetical protein